MRRFVKKLLLFFVPVILLLICLPIDPSLKYIGLKDDCAGHASWFYQRIFQNPKPVDIAFIGSSHTISGIDDQLLDEAFRTKDLHVANLAYCRFRRNMSYVLLKEILERKSPKYVILEVREDEDRYSHPIFPYMANTADVLTPELFFNKDVLSDIGMHLSFKIEMTKEYLFKGLSTPQSHKGNYGFGTTNDTASIEIMERTRLEKMTKLPETETIQRSFYLKYPRSYLKRIRRLCIRNDVELLFLYIPSFGSALDYPNETGTYTQYGKVWIPPPKIFKDPNNWCDPEHLNPSGAKALSEWLIKRIEADFKP